MVLRIESVKERLRELDTILQELSRYQHLPKEEFKTDLSQRWIIERGLISAASLIFDVADHILAGQFAFYATTYEESLATLYAKGVISEELHQNIKGLGGFRNILVHSYIKIEVDEVFENFHKALTVFPHFSRQILSWLDRLES